MRSAEPPRAPRRNAVRTGRAFVPRRRARQCGTRAGTGRGAESCGTRRESCCRRSGAERVGAGRARPKSGARRFERPAAAPSSERAVAHPARNAPLTFLRAVLVRGGRHRVSGSGESAHEREGPGPVVPGPGGRRGEVTRAERTEPGRHPALPHAVRSERSSVLRPHQSSGSQSLNPLAKGLLAIFNCVICREKREVLEDNGWAERRAPSTRARGPGCPAWAPGLGGVSAPVRKCHVVWVTSGAAKPNRWINHTYVFI